MAKEYIDRETTIDAIAADGFEHFSGCLSSSEVTLLELIRDSVSEIPTVDAAEVVHGEWLDGTCTNCGQVDFSKPNYCPNCGSKMDGGR